MKELSVNKITIILFYFYNLCSYSQDIKIDTTLVEYYDLFSKTDYSIETIKITNNSSKDYLTWINVNNIDKLSWEKIIRDYFFKSKGDFSFFQIMTENIIVKPTIGFTFLKCLKSNEIFEYKFLKKDKNISFYCNRIFIIERDKLENYLMKINEIYFFKQNEIILDDSIFNDN